MNTFIGHKLPSRDCNDLIEYVRQLKASTQFDSAAKVCQKDYIWPILVDVGTTVGPRGKLSGFSCMSKLDAIHYHIVIFIDAMKKKVVISEPKIFFILLSRRLFFRWFGIHIYRTCHCGCHLCHSHCKHRYLYHIL